MLLEVCSQAQVARHGRDGYVSVIGGGGIAGQRLSPKSHRKRHPRPTTAILANGTEAINRIGWNRLESV